MILMRADHSAFIKLALSSRSSSSSATKRQRSRISMFGGEKSTFQANPEKIQATRGKKESPKDPRSCAHPPPALSIGLWTSLRFPRARPPLRRHQ